MSPLNWAVAIDANEGQALCRRHLARVNDPVLREKLSPKFELGCRRLIFSDTFYDAIQQPGVALVTEGIERIEPKGIRTRDGRLHELDVLVTATGFHALDYTRNLVIKGEHGVSLGDAWSEGAQARYSLHLRDGFKNTAWVTGCSSWYLDKNGLPRMYPFTPNQYRQDMKAPDVAEFELS